MPKQKLVEQFVVNPDQYEKIESSELTENQQTLSIEEAGKKKTYKAEAVYTFPISRPGEKNLNERVYPKKLWEKVIKEKQGDNSYGLMDHPSDEGSTKDAWCVWRNARFSEDKKLVLADAYLFGPYGRQVKEALEAGGQIGLSTSGFGEFEKDEMTVKADTYELERMADHVLNPSYAVFGTQENAVETEKQEESVVSEEKETIKNDIQPEKEDIDMKNEKLNSFEEKSFRLNVQSRMKEIAKETKASVREGLYNDLLSYFEEGVADDLREKVQEGISSARKEIEELAEKGATLDEKVEESKKELNEKVQSLEKEKEELQAAIEESAEKFDKASELLDSMKAYSNKLKEMYDVALAEKNGMITASEYKETLVYIESLEEEKKELKEQLQGLRERVKSLRERFMNEKKKKKMSDEEDEENDEDDEDDDDEDEKEEKKKEDYSHVKPEILEYYNDLEYAQPAVEAIKEDILAAKTLIEAQRTYLRLKNLIFIEDHERRRPPQESRFFKEEKTAPKRETLNNSIKIREGWV